jgi:hypothetical protein
MNDIPDNLPPEERWCRVIQLAASIQRDRFLAIVQRTIIEEQQPTEPYTPPEGNMPSQCSLCMCKRRDRLPFWSYPANPYIPLALKK